MHHALEQPGIAPEELEGLIEQRLMFVTLDQHRLQRRAEILAVLDADRLHRFQRGDDFGGSDRKTGGAQDARKMQDVFREAARARACNARHEPSSVASTRASAMSCAAISGVTAPMSS